jgi:tetratricopeptide (TPR) repeat protein
MPEVYANKGHVLAQRGQYSEAVTLYEQALQRQPDDRLATALLHDARARQQLAADKEKQARIDKLVDDLVQAYREGRTTQVSPGDGWTSVPLTLAFLPFQRSGIPAPRAGEDDIVLQRTAEALRTSGRVVMVERETLDALLAELKLGASELADPKAAVRIGKLFAARLLVAGGITRQGPELLVSPRLIETETSVLKGATTLTFKNAQDFDQLATSVTERLLAQIRQEYPLQGLIARVAEKEVILNIGKAQGVTPGVMMQVFIEEPIEVSGKVSHLRATVGQIKVKSVQEELAVAEVVEQSETLQQGWKVQEVVKQ